MALPLLFDGVFSSFPVCLRPRVGRCRAYLTDSAGKSGCRRFILDWDNLAFELCAFLGREPLKVLCDFRNFDMQGHRQVFGVVKLLPVRLALKSLIFESACEGSNYPTLKSPEILILAVLV
jgi:hypothetical protein